jgi:uncharacterized protein
MKKVLVVFFLFVFVSANSLFSQSLKFPLQKGFLNDYEELFTPQQQKELSSLLVNYSKKTNKEIVVVTIKEIKPYTNLQDYSYELSYNWSLDKMDQKDGLMVVVSKTLSMVRIMTSYGTEKLLEDDICKNIINTEMIPAYAANKYFDGTKQALISLMKVWN